MKKRILAIAGKPGLYSLVSQGKNMLIVENIETGKRTPAYAADKVMSLGDIAIYTDDEEVKLAEVFTALQKALEGAAAPSPKADEAELVELFSKAVPSYDADRFHVSHMRKVIGWYSELEKYASLDFEADEEDHS